MGKPDRNVGVNELRAVCDLSSLGLDSVEVTRVTLIHRKHGDRLYRIECGARSYVLKWFHDPAHAIEVRSYALLEGLGVPTLPVYGRTEDALLLEDLGSSRHWRLATEVDMEHPETGVAVANWYRALHAAGQELVMSPSGAPTFLKREVDVLTAETVLEIGRKLELAHAPIWELAAEHIEAIKRAVRALPETLNYNDFHWTNLALSHPHDLPLRAIVYDYHLLGIGLRYSDCRNVAGSLGDRAAAAFLEAYGPVSEQERLLDKPTATLYGLLIAVCRPSLPSWARGSVCAVHSGELERSLWRALDIL